MATNKPVAKFRAGQVSASLWENEITVDGRERTVLKAQLERRYKDKNDNWKSSTSFSRNEIPLAVYCLERAFAEMIEHSKDTDDSSAGNDGAE